MTGAPRPTRIALMLESDGPGGAEMMVFQLAKELRRRGHTIVPVGPAQGIGWLGGLFRDADFVPESVHIGPKWFDRERVRKLREIWRTHQIDVVHSHEFEMALYGAVAARLSGLPHIITMHGGLHATAALRRRMALRFAMRLSHTTVGVSHATRQQIARDLGLPEHRLGVVWNGVPERPGNPDRVRAEFGCAPTDLVLLAVGTLERHKGHRVLLEALVLLRERGFTPPWRLIIAGGRGGDQHESLEAYARTHGIADRVHIVTRRNDIGDLQALADVFIMPSIWEGLPMAVLEAMLANNAVIASAVGGIPEAIADGRDGLLVPPSDVPALATALQSVMADAALRTRLANAAYARARRGFTVGVMAERYEELYTAARRG